MRNLRELKKTSMQLKPNYQIIDKKKQKVYINCEYLMVKRWAHPTATELRSIAIKNKQKRRR